jgi:alpha-amylase
MTQPADTPPAADQLIPLRPPSRPVATDISDEVFYHIMPIAWRYGQPAESFDPSTPQHAHRFGNFQGLRDGLPYLADLGITALWLNPIFPSPAYHGYQHGRADEINPWFGTEAEFLAFVQEARAVGIRIYLDLVVYGISQQSEYFTDSFRNRASLYTPMLAYTKPDNSAYIGYTFRTWNGDTVGFTNWDLRNQAARQLVINWSTKWLDPNGDGDPSDGIAGFRLDHVWARYNKGDEGLGYHIDTFWREWREALERVNPLVFTFAEQADWNSFGAELLRSTDGRRVHDAALTKPFQSAAREALRTERADMLYTSMAATLTACPTGHTFMGSIGDHDVDRIASAIGADKPATQGRARAAAAVLLLQPFPPVVYYGDEISMLGVGGNFRSDANDIPRREPMKWAARDDGAPHATNYWALHEGVVKARFSRDNDGRSVEEQQGAPGSVYETHRQLIALRRAHAPLRRGQYAPVPCDAPAVWAFTRSYEGRTLLVLINLSGDEVWVLPSAKGQRTWREALAANALTHLAAFPEAPAPNVDRPVTVGAYGWRVLDVGARAGH